MILGPDRSKLSKRHGATSLIEYRDMGYLPEALSNFLALLGWSLDDRTEIMDRQALIKGFSLERVIKPGAIFNLDKLDWMNGIYIRDMDPVNLAENIRAYWELYPPPEIPQPVDPDYLTNIAPLMQQRLKTLKDAASLISFFFQEELVHDPKALVQKGMDVLTTSAALKEALAEVNGVPDFTAKNLEESLEALRAKLDLSKRQFFSLLRVATTASKVSPPLFETMEVLGRERCSDRMSAALSALAEGNASASQP